jgi:hypothetical protein
MVLFIGAVLAPGRRTVAAALRAAGLAQERAYHKYHNVLARAKWSPAGPVARFWKCW